MAWSLRQLELFLAVVEEGGFSAASARVGMAQPAISIAIRKLEEKCGARLLERSKNTIKTTREGALFVEHARTIRLQVATLERELKDMRSVNTGHVTIGAPPLLSSFVLTKLLEKFLARHPGIRLTIEEDTSETLTERLREAKLDVALVAGYQNMETLDSILLDHHPLVACVASSSPLATRRSISWRLVFQQPLVLFSKGYNQRLLVDRIAKQLGCNLSIVVEAESARLIAAMVAAQRGVAITSSILASETEGVVGIPITGRPSLPIFLARRSGTAPSIAATAFFASASSSGYLIAK